MSTTSSNEPKKTPGKKGGELCITGERIRSLCKSANITQSKLMKDLAITKSNFDKYKSGRTEFPRKLLVEIADYFDVSTDYLLGRCEYSIRDPDIALVREITGLSLPAIIMLANLTENFPVINSVVSDLICSKSFDDLLFDILYAKEYIEKAVADASNRPEVPPAITYNQKASALWHAYADMMEDFSSANYAEFLVYKMIDSFKSTLLEMIDYTSIEVLKKPHFGGDSDAK